MAAYARSSRSTKGDHVPRQALRYVPCSAGFRSSEMEVAQELAAMRAEENSRQAVLAGTRRVAASMRIAGRRGPLHTGELPPRFGLGTRARDRNLAFL
jgi:hypothetical protein